MSKHLLVCSGGGHLKQLNALAQRVGIAPQDQVWVTFDTGLSRGLLADREVVFARYAAPKDVPNISRNAMSARRILKEFDFDSVLSTGSSIAVNYLPVAARRGIPAHYIESAARAAGPSLTGKLLAWDTRVHTYTQYPAWSTKRWRYRGSIFDTFAPGPRRPLTGIGRVVVSVGTTESFGFRRLLARVAPLLAGKEVLWQTGATDVSDLGIDSRESVPALEMEQAIGEADLVIAHAGTGVALTTLQHHKTPLLVPRRVAHREHVDDHQEQIAHELQRRGLAVVAEADVVDEGHFEAAASRSTAIEAEPPPFLLTTPADRGMPRESLTA